jgi:5-methylcytosine-specific restriction endonuclease McrA
MSIAARQPRVERQCPVCQTTVRVVWNQARRTAHSFCCRAHYDQWQKEHPGPAARRRPETWLTLHCDWCGQQFQRSKLVHRRQSVGLAFCSRDHWFQWAAVNYQGERNPSWRGGHPNYRGGNWAVARRRALARDGSRCVDCGTADDLVVHHLRPFAEFGGSLEANELDNLATVCRSDHLRRHELLSRKA